VLQLNPLYLPQLRAALASPHSIGVVGGSPGSSLYLVGHQADSVLYLDPHTVQAAAGGDADWRSFRCDVLRAMPLAGVDPSLALGFYCRGAGDPVFRSAFGAFGRIHASVLSNSSVSGGPLSVAVQTTTEPFARGWRRWSGLPLPHR
jgi:hypothetical protein